MREMRCPEYRDDEHSDEESNSATGGRYSNGDDQSTLLCKKREVEVEKVCTNEKTKLLLPRYLHLYETGKRKLIENRRGEEQELLQPGLPNVCRFPINSARLKKLYRVSKEVQEFGRQRRKNIETASAAKAKNNLSFPLRV